MIGGPADMQLKIGCECGQGGVWQFVYDTYTPGILKADLVGLRVSGNW